MEEKVTHYIYWDGNNAFFPCRRKRMTKKKLKGLVFSYEAHDVTCKRCIKDMIGR